MSLTLEPFAISVELSSRVPRTGSDWVDLLSALLSDLTCRIEAVPGSLIGHLKLRGGTNEKVCGSAVSSGLAPQVRVDIRKDTAALSFNLVCLVYGPSVEILQQTVEASLDHVARVQDISFAYCVARRGMRFSLLHAHTAVTRVTGQS